MDIVVLSFVRCESSFGEISEARLLPVTGDYSPCTGCSMCALSASSHSPVWDLSHVEKLDVRAAKSISSTVFLKRSALQTCTSLALLV